MSLSAVELVGFVAATCTTVAFLPQVVKIWRTRKTEGISLSMYVIFCTGLALWLAYGLLISAWPVVASNVVTLLLAMFILGMKLRYG
jgi:MtN3 and saliva related transmembrane protein